MKEVETTPSHEELLRLLREAKVSTRKLVVTAELSLRQHDIIMVKLKEITVAVPKKTSRD